LSVELEVCCGPYGVFQFYLLAKCLPLNQKAECSIRGHCVNCRCVVLLRAKAFTLTASAKSKILRHRPVTNCGHQKLTKNAFAKIQSSTCFLSIRFNINLCLPFY